MAEFFSIYTYTHLFCVFTAHCNLNNISSFLWDHVSIDTLISPPDTYKQRYFKNKRVPFLDTRVSKSVALCTVNCVQYSLYEIL